MRHGRTISRLIELSRSRVSFTLDSLKDMGQIMLIIILYNIHCISYFLPSARIKNSKNDRHFYFNGNLAAKIKQN